MGVYHIPVFKQEVTEFLDIQKGKQYIDATLGGGGHALEICKRGGEVLGIDVDQDAIDHVQKKIKDQHAEIKNLGKVTLVRGNFKDIAEIARLHGFTDVSGIIFDLGVSSYQLDTQERGFSFQNSGPLDMRMDPSGSSGQVTAEDLVNGLTKGELYELFCKYGEESNAWAIAKSIVSARLVNRITTTGDLAAIIAKSVRRSKNDIHPATRVFQALRIAVNDELYSIEEALPKALTVLGKKGRIIVISFHSLEDRIVKQAFKKFEEEKQGKIITEKPIVPSEEEQVVNRRSRSAKLRVFEKLD